MLRAFVACLLAALLVDGWLLAGLFQPVIVAGGSMAPALCGPHRAWNCTTCGATFVCGHESLPSAGHSAVCPYCGAENDPDLGVDRPGDRVLVDRATYLWRAPRRWEKVVLHCPGAPGSWCVKRIVGLPGERVEFRDGDVWIDGQIAHKDLAELRDVAVLVYQGSRHADLAADQPSRWNDPHRAWRKDQGHWVHTADAADGDSSQTDSIGIADADSAPATETHWLQYEHPPAATTVPQFSRGAINDESPYDQSELRSLNPVGDHMLRAEVTLGDRGTFLIRSRGRGDVFATELNLATGTGWLTHNDRTAATFTAATPQPGRPTTLVWMLADGRAVLRLGGRIVADYSYPPATAGPSDSESAAVGAPLAIGARGADLRLQRIAVYRDVYYIAPQSADRREYRLGDDEYYVLGDNSPHSQDSRSWPRAAVTRARIVGRVLHW